MSIEEQSCLYNTMQKERMFAARAMVATNWGNKKKKKIPNLEVLVKSIKP